MDAGRLSGRRGETALVLALFALGLAHRLLVMPSVRFTTDQSQFWAVARRIALFEAFPTFGPPLTGSAARHPGPLFHYLIALPQTLGASPYLGTVFVISLHLGAGACIHQIARRAAGPRAGLVALALFVFAPWDILYGSSIWLSDVAPVWATLLVFSASRAERPLGQGALAFFVLTSPQFHMSAPIAWVAAAVVLIARRPSRWSLRAVGIGAAIALATYAAPLAHELSHGFANTRAILSRGVGQEPLENLPWIPLEVFGHGVLMSSAEIGYHFARGYWTGGLAETDYYFSAKGFADWWELHGAWGPLLIVSVALSFAAWADSVRSLAFAVRRRAFSEPDVWFAALLAGLATAATLLITSKKGFFPHYINMLTPLTILPLAFAIERGVRSRPRGSLIAAVVVGIVVITMGSSTIRYVRRVDRLNGIAATLEMVRRITKEPEPVRVEFRHYRNRHAFNMLATYRFGRPGWIDPNAKVVYVVHNHRPHQGPVPPGATLHGNVLLQRRPPD